jgi:hypothetical protein
MSIFMSCPDLQRLSLNGCRQLTDASVSGPQSGNFSKLSLRGCTQVTQNGLRSLTGQLHELTLSGCKRVSREIGALLGRNCPGLRSLNLHGVHLDDAAVASIVTGCGLLTSIDLSSANPFGSSCPLTDAALYAVAGLAHLRELNLEGLGLITDGGVEFLSRALPNLRVINMSMLCESS